MKIIMKLEKEIVFGDVNHSEDEIQKIVEDGKMLTISKPYALYNSKDGVSPMPYEEYAVYEAFNKVKINTKHLTWFDDLTKHKTIYDAYIQLTSSIIQNDIPSIIT